MAAALVETRDSREVASTWWRDHPPDARSALHQRHARAAKQFYEQAASHFDEQWRTLNDLARATIVILSLRELGLCTLDSEETEDVAVSAELRKLAELGLTERVGSAWKVGMQTLAWWVGDKIVPARDKWLNDKAYRLLLTSKQRERLMSQIRSSPEQAVPGVNELARTLSEKLVERR
jgi:hypothetical protein